MSNKKIYTLIDLFAGCGGLSLGMEQAGFTSIFFNEIVPVFVSTYKANRNLSDDSCYVGDINELNKHISEYEHIWNNFQHPYSLCTRYRSSRLLGLRSFRLHYAHSAPKSPRLTGGPQNDSGVRSAHNQSQPELPGTSHLPVFRPLVTASKFSSAQRTSSSRIGNRLCPNSVREYSTFGGISEYCRLRISPSISRAFNVSDRTFGDMSGIALAMVLKRVSLFSERTHRISTDHLPENRDRTFRTGQESISVYFRRFSLSSNLLIFNVSYL